MRIARLIYDAAELVGLLHVSQQDGSVANSYGIIRTSSRKLESTQRLSHRCCDDADSLGKATDTAPLMHQTGFLGFFASILSQDCLGILSICKGNLHGKFEQSRPHSRGGFAALVNNASVCTSSLTMLPSSEVQDSR